MSTLKIIDNETKKMSYLYQNLQNNHMNIE